MTLEIPPVDNPALLRQNARDVLARIRAAADRSGRDSAGVTLVAVTKTVSSAVLPLLPELGILDVGENRIQVAEPKMAGAPEGLRWHMIGHLQRNKAAKAFDIFTLFHAVDSQKLIGHLDRLAGERGLKASVLVQLNISRESQKHGIDPDRLPDFLGEASSARNVDVLGLMGMGPFTGDPETCRPLFRELRGRLEEANMRCSYRAPLRELSMGMTNDYEIAVEEGATLLRVGTALFSGVESRSAGPAAGRVEER